jgi:hypothetical protein
VRFAVNDVTAEKAVDGPVTIQFGGGASAIPNCLPIMKGWNCMVRLYRPRSEIPDCSWKFLEAEPAGQQGPEMDVRNLYTCFGRRSRRDCANQGDDDACLTRRSAASCEFRP